MSSIHITMQHLLDFVMENANGNVPRTKCTNSDFSQLRSQIPSVPSVDIERI